MRNIKVENVVNYVTFAEKFEAGKLREACLDFIVKDLYHIIDTQNFRELEAKTLVELIQRKVLIECQKGKVMSSSDSD